MKKRTYDEGDVKENDLALQSKDENGFCDGQLVIIKSNENQFRIKSIKEKDGHLFYYSEKYERYYSADEIEDFEDYWRKKNGKCLYGKP